MEYGQALNAETYQRNSTIHYKENIIDLDLEFKPYQSLLYKIENGKAEQIDIEFIPKTPVVKERPEGYKAPWLVH